MARPFASSADLAAKEQTLEVLADGVYALTAEGVARVLGGLASGRIPVDAIRTRLGRAPLAA